MSACGFGLPGTHNVGDSGARTLTRLVRAMVCGERTRGNERKKQRNKKRVLPTARLGFSTHSSLFPPHPFTGSRGTSRRSPLQHAPRALALPAPGGGPAKPAAGARDPRLQKIDGRAAAAPVGRPVPPFWRAPAPRARGRHCAALDAGVWQGQARPARRDAAACVEGGGPLRGLLPPRARAPPPRSPPARGGCDRGAPRSGRLGNESQALGRARERETHGSPTPLFSFPQSLGTRLHTLPPKKPAC